MENELLNHVSKCRCCFKDLKNLRKNTKITEEIRKQFFEIVQVELNSSDIFSSTICNECKKQLDDAIETRRKFGENQLKLYRFVTEQQPIKTECDSKDPFQIPNLIPEVVVKVEAIDYDNDFVQQTGSFGGYYSETSVFEDSTGNYQNDEFLTPNTQTTPLTISTTIKESPKKGFKLCPYCGKTLTFLSYHKHLKIHHNKMNNIFYHCDICKYKSFEKSRLVDHMFVHKSNDFKTAFRCDFCDYSSFRQQSLKIHVRNLHQMHQRDQIPEQPVTCEICNKTFKTKASLKSHISDSHRGKIHRCDKCDRTFNSNSASKRHFETNHAPKSPCELCGQMVGPGTVLLIHMKNYHSERVQCTVEGCGTFLANATCLKTHMVYKHGPEVQLNCPECNAEFKNEYRLKVHINLQHNTEKRPCPVASCNHSTTRRAYMIMHLKNHKDINGEEKERLIEILKSKKF